MKVMLWNRKNEEFDFVEDVKMVIPQTTFISVVLYDETIIRFGTDEYRLESVWATK